MERRLFLTGLLGMAGATALAAIARPTDAQAGIVDGRGILDQIDEPIEMDATDGEATVQQIWHRHWHRPHYHRPRRRRRVWRRICRRYRHNGRWRTRCERRRVWVFF